ncbi:MAG: GNAT family N-acetyltransferase [Verrucomicrobiota bacterium]
MSDLLVKLYELPSREPALERVQGAGFVLRGAQMPESLTVTRWVEETFGERWASEVSSAFSSHPVRCVLAVSQDKELAGFACYDVTFRGFFGPMGVSESFRDQGLGKALLLTSLHEMRGRGFAYGIIGWASDVGYYESLLGAIEIPGSEPGAYAPPLENR